MLGEISIVNSGKDYKQLNKGNIPVYGTGGYILSVDQYLSKNDAVGSRLPLSITLPSRMITIESMLLA